MRIEALYTHDDTHPPRWTGRVIEPAALGVVAQGGDLEQARRRVRQAVEAAGVRQADYTEWQGVALPLSGGSGA